MIQTSEIDSMVSDYKSQGGSNEQCEDKAH